VYGKNPMPALVGAWAVFAIGSRWNDTEWFGGVCYGVSVVFLVEFAFIAVWRAWSIIKAKQFEV
jgi:hypothetical protein